jgi:hypothetical protein
MPRAPQAGSLCSDRNDAATNQQTWKTTDWKKAAVERRSSLVVTFC